MEETDLILLKKPDIVISKNELFSSTYAGEFEHLHYSFEKLGKELSKDLVGPLLAVNSNFEHSCQPGFNKYEKSVIKTNKKKNEFVKKERQGQGDRTCFNSSVQLTISLSDNPDPNDKKVYKVKLFPTTGKVQVPGVNEQDLSDGLAVLEKTAFILNKNKIGDVIILKLVDEHPQDEHQQDEFEKITIKAHYPIMINYKFKINRISDRLLVNLKPLANYFQLCERLQIISEKPENFEFWKNKFTELGLEFFAPPFMIRETKPPGADVKVSFKFTILCENGKVKHPRINFFQEGKINILGVNSIENANHIYNFFVKLFDSEQNWKKFICIIPKPDNIITIVKVRKPRKKLGKIVELN